MSQRFPLSQLGPYRITALLGRGGMGMVYEGVHEETQEIAALKVLNPGLSDDESFRDRFQAEIETLRKLRHPHIVQLFGFGEDLGHLYYVMERIRGKNLQEELSSGRRFDWREVARVAIQVCSALKHAHDHGIIHRDLKPANLLWTEDEQVKLTDFGIAKLFGMARITQGSVLGTADYMAPEQAAGLPVNSRCDLYSLGCVMYTLLVGRPPFMGKSVVEVIQKAQRDLPVPPAQLVKDIPDELNSIILQLLEKDPTRRVPTALSLSHRLQALMHSLSIRPSQSEAADLLRNEGDHDDGGKPRDVEKEGTSSGTMDNSTPTENRLLPSVLGEFEQPTVAMQLDQYGRPIQSDSADLVVIAASASFESTGTAAGGPLVPGVGVSVKTAESDLGSARKSGSATQYTRVEDLADVVDGGTTSSEFHAWGVAGVLIALAILFVGFWWYLSQPLTADELYSRIAEVTETESVRSWTEVADLMEEFLSRHATDERRSQVAAWSQELDAERYARTLDLKARRIGSIQRLHPYEQFYLQALETSERDLELALQKIQALVTMAQIQLANLQQRAVQMPSPSPTSAPSSPVDGPTPRLGLNSADVDQKLLDEIQTVSRFIEAVRRKQEQLKQEVADEARLHRTFIEQRLAEAAAVEGSQPDEAQAIRHSLLVLYSRYAWAADLLRDVQRTPAAETGARPTQSLKPVESRAD